MNLQFHAPALLLLQKARSTHQLDRKVGGNTAGLKNLVKETTFCLIREPNPDSSVVLFKAQLLYSLSYPNHKLVLEVFRETLNSLSDSIPVISECDIKRIQLRLMFVRICLQKHVTMPRHDTK